MNIPYPLGSPGAETPVVQAYLVMPSDTEELPVCPRCLILSEAIVVTMDLLGGSKAVAVPLQAGFNPIRPTKVYATGTGSAMIVAGY